MNVTLIHAYSATNSGDGLLVDEARDLVLSTFPDAELTLLAIDPDSFDDTKFHMVAHALTGKKGSIGKRQMLLRGLGALLVGRPTAVERIVSNADLVVAVGGGYLRAKVPTEAIRTLLAHYVQLPRAKDNVPFVYLPQSIGPFRSLPRSVFTQRLRRAAVAFVRDDRSGRELGRLPNVVRAPDMALLGLPNDWDALCPSPGGGPVGLVARALVAPRRRQQRYLDSMRELHRDGYELLAQSTGRGNNDHEFYEALGHYGHVRPLRDAVDRSAIARVGVVVSVRLHGSLQAIRSGVPSIHLSYERKGWGAFDDLGVPRFVHNAFQLDVGLVRSQIEELQTDPSGYWRAVSASIPALGGAAVNVRQRLATAAGRR